MFSAKLKVETVNEFQAVILAGYGNRLISKQNSTLYISIYLYHRKK